MKSILLKYSLWAGSMLIFCSLINWCFLSNTLDYTNSEIFGYLSIIMALSMIPLSIRYYQKQRPTTAISSTEILSLGLGISAITATFMYVYSALFFYFVGDDFMLWSKANMDALQWQQMQEQLSTMPSYFLSPWFQAFVMFLTVFLIGFIITIICMLVIKLSQR